LTFSFLIILSLLLKGIYTEALLMKVNYKINTLRGIFLCLTRNKYDPCSHHGFARKEFACFSASFRFFGWPCFTWQNQERLRSSPLQKVEHIPISALYQLIVVYNYHFCKGAKKMFGQSFRTWLLRAKW
jgi:hypothetical protein